LALTKVEVSVTAWTSELTHSVLTFSTKFANLEARMSIAEEMTRATSTELAFAHALIAKQGVNIAVAHALIAKQGVNIGGTSAELAVAHALIAKQGVNIGETSAELAVAHALIAKQGIQITHLDILIAQHSALSHHMMFLVVSQMASMLKVWLKKGVNSKAFSIALQSRGIGLEAFWSLLGKHRINIAHPPLSGIPDEFLARAAKDAFPADLDVYLPIVAAFAIERRCVFF
jgi:hypothetical protein